MNPQTVPAVPGDPEQARRLSARFATVETRAQEILSRLRAIETGLGPQIWRGQAADGFTALLAATGPDLTRLATSYGTAGRALATYASELAAAQDAARAAAAQASTASGDRDRATADRDTARSDADRHAAEAADAQLRLDPAGAQAAEQRRADALQRANAAQAAADQAEQSLQAAQRKADQAASQRDTAAARCIRELEEASRAGIDTRNLAQAPATAGGPPPAAPAESFSLSDLGHTILDVAGLIPVIGEAADGINAAWYTAEGDYTNAALSAAAMIPVVGSAATALKGANKAAAAAVRAANTDAIYTRPSGFRSGVRDQVWNNSIEQSTGRVRDPVTGQFISRNKPWDMGHRPGYEFHKHRRDAAERGISRKQFLDEYNNPEHYRPELPSSNRSHRGEDSTDDYLGP